MRLEEKDNLGTRAKYLHNQCKILFGESVPIAKYASDCIKENTQIINMRIKYFYFGITLFSIEIRLRKIWHAVKINKLKWKRGLEICFSGWPTEIALLEVEIYKNNPWELTLR